MRERWKRRHKINVHMNKYHTVSSNSPVLSVPSVSPLSMSETLKKRAGQGDDGRLVAWLQNINCGKSWSIGVDGDTDEVVLRSGWKEFVDDHGIEEGDCMLLKYTGPSSFDVRMFERYQA